MRKNVNDLALMLCPLILLGSSVAQSAESIVTPGPAGGTDIKQAEQPPPGLYGVIATVDGPLNQQYDVDYGKSDFNGYGAFLGAGLLYVYPFEFFGGHFSSTASGVGALAGAGVPTGNLYHSNGATDTYLDILQYGRFFPSEYFTKQPKGSQLPYGLSLEPGFGIELPTGNYFKGNFLNIGSNFVDLVPNIAATYVMPDLFGGKIGESSTEFSARTFFSNFTKNPSTNYQTGNIISTDFSVSERVGVYQFGLAGTYYIEYQDDSQNSVLLAGRRVEDLTLGPIVSYQFLYNNRPFELAVKAPIPVFAKNTVTGPSVTIRLATKLF